MSAEFLEIFVAVQTGSMPVAKIETQSVISDLLPAQDLNLGVVLLVVTSVLLAEDVTLSASFGAW